MNPKWLLGALAYAALAVGILALTAGCRVVNPEALRWEYVDQWLADHAADRPEEPAEPVPVPVDEEEPEEEPEPVLTFPRYAARAQMVIGRREWTHEDTTATVDGNLLRHAGYQEHIPGAPGRRPCWVLEVGGVTVRFEPWAEELQP